MADTVETIVVTEEVVAAPKKARATKPKSTTTTVKKTTTTTKKTPVVAKKMSDLLTETEAFKIVEDNFYFGAVNKVFSFEQRSQLLRVENIRLLMKESDVWNLEIVKSGKPALTKKEALKQYVTLGKLSSQFMWKVWGEPHTYTVNHSIEDGKTKEQTTYCFFCSVDKCYKVEKIKTLIK